MEWTRGPTIGRGSSATVSLATSGDSVFAAKSVELAQSELLQREHQILSSLGTSPRIVEYKGCDISSEGNQLMYNLLFEYAPSGALSDQIQNRGGSLDETTIGHYTRQIVEGVEYLHSRGFVHCDIKCTNILITDTGAKIGDLGCAKSLISTSCAAAEPIRGTPVFMAPEVARGEEQGFPSDIWSLGCTILEMATGSSPWPNASDPLSVLYRIAFSGEVPELPTALSGEAKDFLGKCLRRDPQERWTAAMLLKHPFLRELNSGRKELEQPNLASPVSILDQSLWSSSDEEEEEESKTVETRAISDTCPRERIRRLSEITSNIHSWKFDGNWIKVRDENMTSSLQGWDMF